MKGEVDIKEIADCRIGETFDDFTISENVAFVRKLEATYEISSKEIERLGLTKVEVDSFCIAHSE